MDFSRDGFAAAGFQGFHTVYELQNGKIGMVPAQAGVYAVLRDPRQDMVFLEENPGGRFKGRNPTVPIETLKQAWVDKADVVYLGKAGSATGGGTLQKRLRQYMDFGNGRPVGHWGGRYIWQLADSRGLRVCWRATEGGAAPQIELQLIQDFTEQYGKRPFANLRD